MSTQITFNSRHEFLGNVLQEYPGEYEDSIASKNTSILSSIKNGFARLTTKLATFYSKICSAIPSLRGRVDTQPANAPTKADYSNRLSSLIRVQPQITDTMSISKILIMKCRNMKREMRQKYSN